MDLLWDRKLWVVVHGFEVVYIVHDQRFYEAATRSAFLVCVRPTDLVHDLTILQRSDLNTAEF